MHMGTPRTQPQLEIIKDSTPFCPECMVNMNREMWVDPETSNGISEYDYVLVCPVCKAVYKECDDDGEPKYVD